VTPDSFDVPFDDPELPLPGDAPFPEVLLGGRTDPVVGAVPLDDVGGVGLATPELPATAPSLLLEPLPSFVADFGGQGLAASIPEPCPRAPPAGAELCAIAAGANATIAAAAAHQRDFMPISNAARSFSPCQRSSRGSRSARKGTRPMAPRLSGEVYACGVGHGGQ
jgi:hypothetical protein